MSVVFTILSESEYPDLKDPKTPVPMVLVTFSTPEGRIDSVALPKKGYDDRRRNELIAAKLRQLKGKPPQTVTL